MDINKFEKYYRAFCVFLIVVFIISLSVVKYLNDRDYERYLLQRQIKINEYNNGIKRPIRQNE